MHAGASQLFVLGVGSEGRSFCYPASFFKYNRQRNFVGSKPGVERIGRTRKQTERRNMHMGCAPTRAV